MHLTSGERDAMARAMLALFFPDARTRAVDVARALARADNPGGLDATVDYAELAALFVAAHARNPAVSSVVRGILTNKGVGEPENWFGSSLSNPGARAVALKVTNASTQSPTTR